MSLAGKTVVRKSAQQSTRRRDISNPWPLAPLSPGVCGWCTDTCLGAVRCGEATGHSQVEATQPRPSQTRAKPPLTSLTIAAYCIVYSDLSHPRLRPLCSQLTSRLSPRSGLTQRRDAHCTPTARTGLVEPIVWGPDSSAVVLQHDGTCLARCNTERQPDQLASSQSTAASALWPNAHRMLPTSSQRHSAPAAYLQNTQYTGPGNELATAASRHGARMGRRRTLERQHS